MIKIERSSRASDKKGGCRHVACQTNLGGGSLQAAQKAVRSGPPPTSRPGMGPPQSNNQRPNNTAGSKRNQEVVDLTDEDSTPAMKRSNSGHGLGGNPGFNHSVPNSYGGVPASTGPNSAALQQLVASGAAKVVNTGGGRGVPNPSPYQNRGVGGNNTTAQNGHSQNYPHFNNRPVQPQQQQYQQQQFQRQPLNSRPRDNRHPAPLPAAQVVMVLGAKMPPPKPFLKIEVVKVQSNGDQKGVMLSWDIVATELASCAKIQKYQLYAYQETQVAPSTALWKKIGDDVDAMPLPMACTLSHFLAKHYYHFAVRAMDEHSRIGPFSDAQTIYLD